MGPEKFAKTEMLTEHASPGKDRKEGCQGTEVNSESQFPHLQEELIPQDFLSAPSRALPGFHGHTKEKTQEVIPPSQEAIAPPRVHKHHFQHLCDSHMGLGVLQYSNINT